MTGNNTTSSKWQANFLQFLGWFAVFGGGGFAFWAKRDAPTLGLVLGAGFLTVLLSQLDKIEVLKGGGVEFRYRQVERAKDEALDALQEAKKAQAGAERAQESTRQFAVESVRANLSRLPFVGRLGGTPSFAEIVAERDRFLELLTDLGVAPDETQRAAGDFDEKMRLLLKMKVVKAMMQAAREKHDRDLEEKAHAFANVKNGEPSTAELKQFSTDEDLQSTGVRDAFQALHLFEETGSLPVGYIEPE